MDTTNTRLPMYFPSINLYLLILGKTIKPVFLLNSEQIIPEKNKQAANKVKKDINCKPLVMNSAGVFERRKDGINGNIYPIKTPIKIAITEKK